MPLGGLAIAKLSRATAASPNSRSATSVVRWLVGGSVRLHCAVARSLVCAFVNISLHTTFEPCVVWMARVTSREEARRAVDVRTGRMGKAGHEPGRTKTHA